MSTEIIPVSLCDWRHLLEDAHPRFDLVSYGMKPNSGIVHQLVTRRKADGIVFIGEISAQFRDDTDWDSPQHLTDLRVAKTRVIYE